MKRVVRLHDKFHREVVFNVLIDEDDITNLAKFWKVWHDVHNSKSEESKDIYAFVDEAREAGVNSIEELDSDDLAIK